MWVRHGWVRTSALLNMLCVDVGGSTLHTCSSQLSDALHMPAACIDINDLDRLGQ
jgi:hypothetical protein